MRWNLFGLLSILDCLFTGVTTETKLIINIEFTINFSLNQNGTSVFFKLRSDYEKKNKENYYYIYLGHSCLSVYWDLLCIRESVETGQLRAPYLCAAQANLSKVRR